MEDGILPFVESLAGLSGPAVVAFFLWLVIRGHLITAAHYASVISDRDTWRELALDAISIGEQAVREKVGQPPVE